AAAALGCESWQQSRIPSWPARFSPPAACHRVPLLWLRLATTDRRTRPILTVDRPPSPSCASTPNGFARFEDRRVQIHVRPGKFLFRITPTSGFVRLRGRISAHAPEKNRV